MKTGATRPSVRLGRARRLGLYLVCLGVWASGGLWLLLHYFFVQQGEFGAKANPLEPWSMKVHGAFAFGAVWVFGLLWGVHVTRAWPYPRRRRSGAVLTGVFAVLIVSGYLLYYTGNDRARAVVSVIHCGIGLGSPAALVWHRLRKRKRMKRVAADSRVLRSSSEA